jgi:hypothetical protein
VDPVPGPLFLRKSGSAGNQTLTSVGFTLTVANRPTERKQKLRMNAVFQTGSYKESGIIFISDTSNAAGQYLTCNVQTFLHDAALC